MNKNKYKKNNLRPIILLSAILVAACLAYGAVGHARHWWPFKVAPPAQSGPIINARTAHPSPKNNNPNPKTDTPPPTTDETSNKIPVDTGLVATITRLDESNGQVNFDATIKNTSGTGTCVVTFSTPNDRPVTKQFNSTYSSGVSTCGPLTISANEFSYLGTWQVDFHYYIGAAQATAQSEINIR